MAVKNDMFIRKKDICANLGEEDFSAVAFASILPKADEVACPEIVGYTVRILEKERHSPFVSMNTRLT